MSSDTLLLRIAFKWYFKFTFILQMSKLILL